MARPKSEKRACVYVADTECTTNIDYEQDGHVYAYLMNMQSVRTAEMSTGNATGMPEEMTFSGPETMSQWTDSFLERIPGSADLWFYNTRYDCQFIMDYLMRHRGYVSYSWSRKQEMKGERARAERDYLREHPEARATAVWNDGDVSLGRHRKVPKAVVSEFEKKRVVQPIRSGSRLIELDIYNAKGNLLRIMDVGSKFTNLPQWDEEADEPMTGVQAIARMYGGSKTGLDVLKYRGDGYEPDEEEILRCSTDTHWIRLAMEDMYSLGLTRSTLAGDAWSIFSAMRKIGIDADDRSGKRRELLSGLGIEVTAGEWKEDGILTDMKEIWDGFEDGMVIDIRDAYKGGVTYNNPKFQNRTLRTRKGHRIAHDDCNSMHPKSMVCEMPYGAPVRSVGQPVKDFYIVKCYCRFKLKKGRWPTISNSASGMECAEWLSEGERMLTMTSYDWKWFMRNYEVEVIGERYYLNWDVRINDACARYVEHYTAEKTRWKKVRDDESLSAEERQKGSIMYYVSKILMNALYGKFGQDPVKPYEWCEFSEGIVKYKASDVRKNEYEDSEFHKYLPFACAVTGCSRDRLYEHIEQIGYENFIYGDTDSAFFWTPCETDEELKVWLIGKGVDVDKTRLGAWDIEHGLKEGKKITEAKFVRAKVYGLVQENGEVTVKTAGLPIMARKAIRNLDEMYIGAVFPGAKLVPMNVPGGQILVAKDFTLKEH